MGTSGSSKGSPGKVPMVPSWVPDVPAAPPANPGSPPDASPPADNAPANTPAPDTAPVAAPTAPAPPIPIAPSGRFAAARRSAGNFARTGSSSDLRRSIGHYVKTGYGGASTAARRLGGTARTAGSLYGTLSPAPTQAPSGPDAGARLDRALLSGRSANEIMSAVVEAVRPVDGTQDAEASRTAIKSCLSEVLVRFPGADLLELSEEQRAFAVERYVALDVFERFVLDLGKTIQDKSPNASAALARLKDVKDYIRETVSSAFRRLRDAGRTLSAGRVSQIVQRALLDALHVFEQSSE
jgi:hypothetical protein